MTLLVIPAADLHPLGGRDPGLAAWLRARVAAGDCVAQHGLAHQREQRVVGLRRALPPWPPNAVAEFAGLTGQAVADRVLLGRRLLRDIELEPRGFVAPAYAYTPGLRRVLASSFDWVADLWGIRTADRRLLAPALCLGSSTAAKRAVSPFLARALGCLDGPLMRVDVHPADLELPRHRATLDVLLTRARTRTAITYDDLVA